MIETREVCSSSHRDRDALARDTRTGSIPDRSTKPHRPTACAVALAESDANRPAASSRVSRLAREPRRPRLIIAPPCQYQGRLLRQVARGVGRMGLSAGSRPGS